MDRRLKERLIGATILVVLIVAIVPELLSGPHRAVTLPPAGNAAPTSGQAAESMRNVTVDLATNKATPEPPAASATAAPSSPGVDSVTSNEAGAADEKSEHAAPPPSTAPPTVNTPPVISTLKAQQPTPMAADKAAPQPSAPHESAAQDSAHRGWNVQIGSFSSRVNADKQVHHLKSHEFLAYVSATGSGKSLRYRVRIGPFADRPSAERAAAKLKKNGQSASLVPP